MKNLKNNSISLLCLVAFLTLALPAHAGGTNEKPTTYAIGDTGPAGGIVFYITDGGLHGMEATPDDQHEGIGLCFSGVIPGADGTAIGTGWQNTQDMLNDCEKRPIAASVAADYPGPNGDSLGEWFLPSKDALNELYLNKGVVGGFASDSCWSSSEDGRNEAHVQFFPGGHQTYGKEEVNRVRVVRAF
jgi:hypothetical protein